MYLWILMVTIILLIYIVLIIRIGACWNENSSGTVQAELRPVSILLPVRNEEENIRAIVENVLAQSYNLWELIVVNDHSDDYTVKVLEKLDDNRITILNLPPLTTGKKAAITYGLEHAQADWIITIDADVTLPKNWLSTLTKYLRPGICLVGPVQLTTPNNTLEILQFWDLIAMQGFTRFGIETDLFAMGNGANLIFEKSAFQKVQGFAGNDHIDSGDDLFLLNKFQRDPGRSIQYVAHPDVIVSAAPCRDLDAFLAQRNTLGRENAVFARVCPQISFGFDLCRQCPLGLWYCCLFGNRKSLVAFGCFGKDAR